MIEALALIINPELAISCSGDRSEKEQPDMNDMTNELDTQNDVLASALSWLRNMESLD